MQDDPPDALLACSPVPHILQIYSSLVNHKSEMYIRLWPAKVPHRTYCKKNGLLFLNKTNTSSIVLSSHKDVKPLRLLPYLISAAIPVLQLHAPFHRVLKLLLSILTAPEEIAIGCTGADFSRDGFRSSSEASIFFWKIYSVTALLLNLPPGHVTHDACVKQTQQALKHKPIQMVPTKQLDSDLNIIKVAVRHDFSQLWGFEMDSLMWIRACGTRILQ